MGQITSLYVYKVVGQASPGVETRDLVEGMGLDPDGPVETARMVSSADYYRFFEALVERDPDGLILPLRIGASMRSDEYGAFGLAWKSAPDLRGSYVRSERYGRVLGNAEVYRLEPGEAGVYYTLEKAGEDRLGMHMSNEASLAAVATISQEVSTAPFVPKAVYFKHMARGDPSAYEAHFGCPVYFGSARDALLVHEASLAAPNRLGDTTIAQFFDRHLEQELAGLSDDTGLEHRVRRAVAQALSEGIPSLSMIARGLGMSARTLQRRLAEQGRSFQSLVDLARRDLAEQLLRDTDYSLAEIAFLTGFSEQSAFTRAFKRWSGQTPRSYRLA
ncbi:MAG: AraC family transcriptional regulator ligand-binding domain-containing protein [Henriciella sp.]|nr:AraC family transcriptional regulator ligand-binding domain-containing protein [Henriciella sp.]